MDAQQNVGGRDRLARAVLAVVLSIVAVRWLKSGKRGRGLLAAIGAATFGYNATTGHSKVNDRLDVDTTAGESLSETVTDTATEAVGGETMAKGQMTCAFCGDPIEPGQRRVPNDQGQIVHQECA